MPGIISKGSIESVRAACDIVDLVGSRVRLLRSGHTFKALCPFHKEKSPSFHVNPQRQAFHCFGCGVGGDIFKFVMLSDQVDFVTAVKLLAQRCNIALQFEGGGDADGDSTGREALFRVQEDLAGFYRRILQEHASGLPGRHYLEQRKIDAQTAQSFEIGFAPDSTDVLRRWAEHRKIDLRLIAESGVLIANDDGTFYDRFRGRLMFPLRDELGRVCGFSGRIIEKDQHPAKYVNSPETAVFKKSRFLFGLHLARKSILDRRTALVCEGQIDVIRCHASGMTHAVAGLGTALTEDHARLIRRYADSVILLLDADAAGQNAALRSADLFTAAGLVVRAASLPAGDDPDSLVLKAGPEALASVIDRAESALDFRISVLSGRETPGDEAGQLRVIRAALESIGMAPTAAQQEQMAQSAARRLGISATSLMSDLQRKRRPPASPTRPSTDAPGTSESLSEPTPDEREIVRLLYHHPEIAETLAQYLPLQLISNADCRTLIAALLRGCANPLQELPDANPGVVRIASEIMVSETRVKGDETPPEAACGDLIIRIHRRAMEQRRKALEERRQGTTGEHRERIDLELKQLVMDLHTLRRGWVHARALLDLQSSP